MHNEYAIENARKKYGKKYLDPKYKTGLRHEATGKAFWETILGFECLLNNRYAIIPKRNLVSNIGMTEGSTHSNSDVAMLAKSQQKIFNNTINEIEFPLKHPQYIVPDFYYMKNVDILMGNGVPVRNFYRKIVYVVKCILHGKIDFIFAGIKRRINRIRSKK